MPLFTFYPRKADGSSAAFETIECGGDEEAMARARRVLEDHLSAVEVVIWHGERCLGALTRIGNPA